MGGRGREVGLKGKTGEEGSKEEGRRKRGRKQEDHLGVLIRSLYANEAGKGRGQEV